MIVISQMILCDLDVKKMPLGKISKAQIAKGFEALEKISEALKQNHRFHLNDLSSKFYTVIPHDFGRQRPLAITSEEMLQKKMDLLTVSIVICTLTRVVYIA